MAYDKMQIQSEQQLLKNTTGNNQVQLTTVIIKERVFYFLVILIAITLAYKTISLPIQQTIIVEVMQQKYHLQNLFSVKDTQYSTQFSVNTLHFPLAKELYHDNTGFLDYKEDFFLSLHTRFKVKKTAYIRFIILSDDGFQLKINKQSICQFAQARAMQETICEPIKLQAGIHSLSLDYFQGFGELGLIGKYIICDKPDCDQTDLLKKAIIIGKNSSSVVFLPIDNKQG